MNKIVYVAGFIFIILFIMSLFAKIKVTLIGMTQEIYSIRLWELYKSLLFKPTKTTKLRLSSFVDISIGF